MGLEYILYAIYFKVFLLGLISMLFVVSKDTLNNLMVKDFFEEAHGSPEEIRSIQQFFT
jgi:hypothetical protein